MGNAVLRRPLQQEGLSAAMRNVMLLAVCGIICVIVAGILWGTNLPATVKYVIGLCLFAVITAMFVVSRLQQRVAPLFELPVFISLLAFLQFGLAPLYNFFIQADELPPMVTLEGLVNALPLCVIGITAFWAGAASVRHRVYEAPNFVRVAQQADDSRILGWTLGMFAVGLAAQAFINLSYLNPTPDSAQFLFIASQLSCFALTAVAIEVNSRAESGKFRIAYWVMLPTQCVVGFFSGMKAPVLEGLLIVAMVTWMCRQSIPKRWVIGGILGLIILYPVVTSMRHNESVYGVRATDLESAVTTSSEAIRHADQGDGWVLQGVKDSVSRLDVLSSVAQIQAFGPAIDFVDCGEKVWMIPFYPFVPRAIWKNKPILNQGQKFSVLLGGNDSTSIALTYVGDAYRLGGTAGALVAMFLWGVLAELLVQFVYQNFSKTRLFMYIGVAYVITSSPIEDVVFTTWGGTLKQFVVVGVIALCIYGRKQHLRIPVRHGGVV